MADKVVPRMKK